MIESQKKLVQIYKFKISENNPIKISDIPLGKISVLLGENGSGKTNFMRRIENSTVYYFLENNVKKSINKKLYANGTNIGTVLSNLKINFEENYNKIVEIIKLAFPQFSRFSFGIKDNYLNNYSLKVHLNDEIVPTSCHYLSDGMMRFICLTTLLNSPEKYLPNIILIDDPDLGLHSSCTCLIAEMVKYVSLKRQIIITAKSNNFIESFDESDFIIVKLKKDNCCLYRFS